MPAMATHETEAGRDQRPATVKVWDPVIRIFHWLLVVLFALAWVTEDLQRLHQPVGYTRRRSMWRSSSTRCAP
jgi:hypothetical protein